MTRPDEHDVSVGAYTFVTSDWKEKDYPFDIWLEHALEIFDQVAVVTYGDLGLVSKGNLLVKCMPSVPQSIFEFYVKGKEAAQKLLTTKWKVLLDIDEFLPRRIDTRDLDERYAYPLKYHHLYGNLQTEIVSKRSVRYQFRIHTGHRAVLGDGANVGPPYPGIVNVPKIIPLFALGMLRRVRSSLNRNERDISGKTFSLREVFGNAFAEAYAFSYGAGAIQQSFDVYHTNTVRRPEALTEKWIIQIRRELREGQRHDAKVLAFLEKNTMNYKSFLRLQPTAKLLKVPSDCLPAILTRNIDRFNHSDL